jgi:UDPglucose 6-dehydrogenase
MKKIAVIGTGYVGLVSGTCFAEIGHQVICCDVNEAKIELLRGGGIPIYEAGLEELVQRNVAAGRLTFTTDIPGAVREADVIFIAVGTPMSPTGEADLSYVQAAATTIAQHIDRYKVIVNKSTVPVGTGRLVQEIVQAKLSDPSIPFDVVSNPEFLREGSAVHDCMNMERAIIGATSERAADVVAGLHEPFHTIIVKTDLESAEMIKYAANAFLATKISFINDIANLCERVGADVSKVSEGLGLDSRIGRRFLQAGIGYGGSCFPKDTQALYHTATGLGYDFHLLDAVMRTNEEQRYRFVQKIVDEMGSVAGRTIAVLGLTFKPNTDDMRYAPSLTVIPELLRRGAVVRAFDSVGVPEARKLLGEDVAYFTEIYEALQGADACVILTEWDEVLKLDFAKAKALLGRRLIIDGRNCYALERMEQEGFRYVSVGRPSVGKLADG